MQTDTILRQHLRKLLEGSEAHVDFEAAIKNMPAKVRGQRPQGAEHSPWEVVEHMRIALWDILEFSQNANHKSPEWPGGYWPSAQAPTNEKAWEHSVQAFRDHLQALGNLVADESTDLFSRIPHGDGQTILREALLAADHNAYHIGEIVLLRRLLGAWH